MGGTPGVVVVPILKGLFSSSFLLLHHFDLMLEMSVIPFSLGFRPIGDLEVPKLIVATTAFILMFLQRIFSAFSIDNHLLVLLDLFLILEGFSTIFEHLNSSSTVEI